MNLLPHALNLADPFDPEGIVSFYWKSKIFILTEYFWNSKLFCYFSFKSEGIYVSFSNYFQGFFVLYPCLKL